MYTLVIEDHFDAAHNLRDYDGACARVHGHTWKVELAVKGDSLNKLGILVDFKELKPRLKKILDRFDHYCINELEPFDKINPTAENLSQHIYNEVLLAGDLPQSVHVEWVRVWESPKAYCQYSE